MPLRRKSLAPAPDRTTPSARPTLAPRPLADRWWGKALLLLVGVSLLSLSIAPFGQFYAAWVGLVPWLVVVRHCRGPVRAALWSWLAGIAYFSANMWWLAFITGPGLIALMAVLGAYWAGAAAVLWPWIALGKPGPGVGVGGVRTGVDGPTDDLVPATSGSRPPATDSRLPFALLVLLPVAWVGFEWLRGAWPFNGLPWLYLAHSQTTALLVCQIADTTGELGVSAWVALVNGLVALFVFNGWRLRGLLKPVVAVAGVSVAVVAYGVWRFAQTPGVLAPGPRVLVVQPNYPQDNSSGNKGATPEEIVEYHVSQTNGALQRDPSVDLAVWSETMMPPLNPESRAAWRKIVARINVREPSFENLPDKAHQQVANLARRYKCGLLVGSSYVQDYKVDEDGTLSDVGRRNSAFLYQRDTGEQAGRFDKIHTVPFGEYIPFKEGWPWLYRQMVALGPPHMENYQLASGDRPVVFALPKDRMAKPAVPPATGPSTPPAGAAAAPADPAKAWRFVTPICFEDIDGDLVARMVRGDAPRGSLPPSPDGRPAAKAADLIVNITNDGWFGVDLFPNDRWYRGGQMAQHLRVGSFRSIENRVPTARAVNTGISGFVDSLGRTGDGSLVPTGTEGTLTAQVMLDGRTTFYTQWGNLIGPACGIATGLVAVTRAGRRLRRRSPK